MGWWPTNRPGEIIGDDVADEIIGSFRLLEKMTGKRPTFQALLDGIAHMVLSEGEDFLSDPASVKGKQLEAVFEPPAPTLVSTVPAPLDEALFDLGVLLRKIAGHYMSTDHRRLPHLTEILDGFAFVLRVDPEELLRDAEGLKLVEFRIKQD